MDSITHLVLGAAIGEALLGKRLGKKAMLWGALADTIPDVDVFVSAFYRSTDGLLIHRGITHSFLFLLLLPPLLGKLFSRLNFRNQATWQQWAMLFFLGMFTHVIIDSMTAYGTGLLEPFSHYRVSFNSIFVADPFYTFPLIVSTIALMILKKDSRNRKGWNKFGLYLSTLYLAFTFANKAYVDSVFETSMSKQGITYKRNMCTPTPLNNFLWMGIAEDSKGFYIGYYSVFDHSRDIPFHYVPKNDSLFEVTAEEKAKTKLRIFSNGYYCITNIDSVISFNDLRFGQIGGWDDPNTPFAFSNVLNRKQQGALLNRSRWKGTLGDAFHSLVKRTKGI